MLQIDHIYEFFYENIFRDFGIGYLNGGVTNPDSDNFDIVIFNRYANPRFKMFFFDQEPILPSIHQPYFTKFDNIDHVQTVRSEPILVSSEKSATLDQLLKDKNYYYFYYFFHGFAAIDWFRGHQALNFSKNVVRKYERDYISYNRIIVTDRAYRIYFVSNLIEKQILQKGYVSFDVSSNDPKTYLDEIDDPNTKLSSSAISHIKKNLTQISLPLVIDSAKVTGFKSADIPRTIKDHIQDPINVDSFWHIVGETVFYYDKLHLTEKIFKPIVSKQPFMLLAAPGNLEYLRSYGFKTFNSVIDESYDKETDPDLRIQKVVEQLKWYCDLSPEGKTQVQRELEPIIEHNFRHFYGKFRQVITTELLQNCQRLFKEIGYDDSAIAYKDLYRVLTS